jgi:hypothetical protein
MKCTTLLALAFGTCLCATSFAWISEQSGGARQPAGLAPTQMAGIFGDACATCTKALKCNTGFTSGANDCAYCDTNHERVKCCNVEGGAGDCTEGTGNKVCGGSNQFTGARSGEAGNCGTCVSLVFAQHGTCTEFQDATGTACPVKK